MNTTAPALSAKGQSGELRHGYHVAARFGAWALTSEWTQESLRKPDEGMPSSCIVTVSNLEPDGYWFGEQPHDLRLQIGTRLWVWREAERIDDAHYRVSGDPEVV